MPTKELNSEISIDEKRKALVMRLKRIEGQTRSLQTLVGESEDCEKVAQQLAAVRKALDKCFFATIACMMEQELGDESEKIERYTELLTKYG